MSPGGPFSFHYGPRLRAGAGASVMVGELFSCGSVLFVTDKTVLELGLARPAIDALEASGGEVIIFDAVEPDPSLATVLAAQALGLEKGVGAVIGLGGGSPMDVAKLIAYLLGSGDDVETLWGVDKALGQRLPLALIPTTAGTGSEATPVTVITVGETEKKGINSAALTADWALLDPELTTGLPRHVTAATGIDAMVHAVEAYTSARLKNPMSDMLAREALRLLSANLLLACDEPSDLEARGAMLLGAHLAGIAFANAPVAGVHALAYPLRGHFHVPHGLSNALMLPHVLGHNMPDALVLYAELGVVLDPSTQGLGKQTQASALVERLMTLSAQAGLPQRLADVGVTPNDLDLLASEAMKQTRLLVNNPRAITETDARRLYAAAL